MSLRRKLAATAATALLLSTACGGASDDSADDPVPGVDEGEETSPTPEDEATPEPEAQHGSEIELPDDVELVFDWDTPEDPDEAAALHGASEYLRAIAADIVAQAPEGGVHQGYARDQAGDYARTQVRQWVDGGWTMYGTDHFYDATVERGEGESANMLVEFCNDTSQLPGKDVASGEVLPAEEQHDVSIYLYRVVMAEAPGVEGFWQASHVEVEGGAERCGA
ncbi:hypothetical protein [Streptomyces profundus]|uniref:hypothetical protein n=1 Tax=Streptomyces profundus TaxID=2867410 RepID=UPI001D16DCFF|nr:hypothetical protein [Streptomyces sp. MA3_2.13]UED84571.1 hypothetical protein K4G22_10450 [Streptomyces sp. MA3_2.13]